MLKAGFKLGPYEILAPLGKGGMGEVYRARDARLGRDVAIKVLPPSLADSEDALKRFEQEARSVAALSHPNILNVFDIGTHETVTYVVLELLEGETLRERLKGETLPWPKAVEIASGIADGLAAAHARGIVHRDLKPENLFITTDSVVKILDFGLARSETAVTQTPDSPTMTAATRPGAVMGTIGYMSPEQLRGKPVDTRTDIFSFGCVLYEMLTAGQAFVRDTAADTLTAILTEAPTDASAVNANIPSELSRVLTRCLEKKADERFHSARDLSFALRTLVSDSGSPGQAANNVPVGHARRNVFLGATALAIFIVGVSFLLSRIFAPDRSASPAVNGAAVTSLAVLPFECASGDPDAEFLGEGIAESVLNRMTSIDQLRVIPRNTAFLFRGRNSSLNQVARELNVQAILTGRVVRRGDRLTISASLEDVPRSQQLWGERFDEHRDNILQIEAKIADRIADALRLQLTGRQRSQLARSGTGNPDAHLAYMQGRFLRRHETAEGVRQASTAFERAIDLDPDFAAAYAGLAGVYVNSVTWSISPPEETVPKIQAALQRALELDPSDVSTLTQRARAATMIDWDWQAGQDDLRRALDLDPNYALARHHLGHVLALLGRHDEARIEFERAAELEPLAPMHLECLGGHYVKLEQYDDAERVLKEALKWEPHYAPAYRNLAWVADRRGDVSEALRYAEKAHDAADGEVLDISVLGYYAAESGDESRARQLLHDLLARQTESFVAEVEIARIHVGLGEFEKAIDILEDAVENHSASWLPGKLVELGFEPLFGRARFDALFPRMGLKATAAVRPRDPISTVMPRLAVLPFEVPAGEPDTAFLGDGIPEGIINRLQAALPELVVAPRPLAFQFRGLSINLDDVARSLKVNSVVTGRVTQQGDRLVVRSELTDIAQRRHLWGDRFDESMSDILRVEEAIATEIAEALMPELTGQQRQQLAKSETDDPRAHVAYLNGRFWWRQHWPEANRRALPYFEDAIAADPGFALAYAGIADVYSTKSGFSAEESRARAKTAIRKAMALDDSLAEVQTAQGLVHMNHEWDWEAAEKNYLRALEINSDFGWAHHVYGHLLTVLYRYDEAREHFERALELEPRNTDNYVCLGGQYLRMGLYEEAGRVLTDSQATATPFGLDLCADYLGWMYLRQQKYDEAIAVFERAVQESNRGWYAVSLLATGEAMRGNEKQARVLLDELLTRARPANVAGEFLAPIYIALGDEDEALRLLEESYESRLNMWLPVELFRPGFDSLLGNPRFNALLSRMHVPTRSPVAGHLIEDGKEPPGEKTRLAILPFDDNSPEPQEWLASGLADVISMRLGRVNPEKLGVVGPETTAYYARASKPIQEICEELNVAFVLDGSIQSIGSDVRIMAKLIHADDLTSIWSEEFKGTLDDPFALQSMVAQKIMTGLPLELTGEERTLFKNSYAPKTAAEVAYMRGLFLRDWEATNPKNLSRAISYFEQAIETDPDYPLPYCGLVDAKCMLATWGTLQTAQIRSDVEVAVDRALELDPRLPEAHMSAGIAATYLNWDWAAAEAAFERAIELNPNLAHAFSEYGYMLVFVGRYAEAQERFEEAIRLNPKSSVHHSALGMLHAGLGRLAEAEQLLLKAHELNEDRTDPLVWLADVRQKQGRFDEAVDIMERAVMHKEQPELAVRAFLGNAYALAGRMDDAREQLAEMRKSGLSGHHIWFGEIHAALGETDEAFRRLNQALEARESWLPHIRFDPGLIHIRNDPRFAELHRQMGLGHVDLSVPMTVP